MEIVWHGHSCFRLRKRGAAVVTDPCSKDVGYRMRFMNDLVEEVLMDGGASFPQDDH